jgi:UDPglucose--hexose-1-phosphate uridylyltransferase
MGATRGPVLRYDAATRDWVVFAPARAKRPKTVARPRIAGPFVPPHAAGAVVDCPFCPGNEHLTPPEIFRLEDERSHRWNVRVVPNKFPAVSAGAGRRRAAAGAVGRERAGYGMHEIIIESPEHTRPLAHQPLAQIERILSVVRARCIAMMDDSRIRAIIPFKNHGDGAGTSRAHPHWQIVALPVVPRLLRVEQAAAIDYFDRTSRCLSCVLLDDELSSGRRVLTTNEAFASVLPHASRFPYQVRILPRTQRASFASIARGEVRLLAAMLQEVLTRLDAALGDPDFNLIVDSAPRGCEDARYYLWHLDVLPRLTTAGGFELGSGMSINSVMPEDATVALRAMVTPRAADR